MEGRHARSRLTCEDFVRLDRLVRRRVSGAIPTVKDVGLLGESGGRRAVTVRQVPLMQMESPS